MTKDERVFLERIEDKITCLEKKLMDPDTGLFARVNENTRWRRKGQRVLNYLLSGILLGVVALLFFIIRNGIAK